LSGWRPGTTPTSDLRLKNSILHFPTAVDRLHTAMASASLPNEHRQCASRDVWTLLTRPGDFYDVRIASVEPPGPAEVGQTVFGETGPRLLHLKLEFRFTQIDAANYTLGFDVRLPFGVTVREDLNCVPLSQHQCRVNYHCDFAFPTGWRGAVARFLMRRELDAGPVDSLNRLQRAAERSHASSAQTCRIP